MGAGKGKDALKAALGHAAVHPACTVTVAVGSCCLPWKTQCLPSLPILLSLERENQLSQSLSTQQDKEDCEELSSNLRSEPAHGCCASCSRSSADASQRRGWSCSPGAGFTRCRIHPAHPAGGGTERRRKESSN